MTLERPTLVLFDMDGTTVRHVNPFWLSLLERIDSMIYALTRLFSRQGVITDFSEDPAVPRGLLVHRVLHKMRRKNVEQIVQPCPGIYLVLNLLRRHNIPMGIVSNGLGAGYGDDILKTFGLLPYFKAQIFREDIQKSKPHPDPILRGLRAMKAKPDAQDIVWYIGDRRKDIIAAIEADKLSDCKIVPFSYGLHAAMSILKNNIGTDHIIMNYPDFFMKIKPMLEGTEEDKATKSPYSESAKLPKPNSPNNKD